MKKKWGSLLMAAIAAAGILSGCQKGENTGGVSDASGTTEKSGEQQVLEVALFEGGLGKQFWEEIISEFEKTHPDIKVNATINPKVGEMIRPKIVAGNLPDFVDLSDTDPSGVLPSLIKDRQLVDITDVFEGNAYDQDVPLKDLIADGFLTGKKFSPYGDGKVYIAPKYCGPVGLVYDKNLFREKGWDLPETWDEFFELGDKAKEEGIALFVYPGIYPYYLEHFTLSAFANEVGMDAMNDMFAYKEGSFGNPEMLKVLEQLEKLGKGGYILEGSTALNHTQAQTEMMLGNALFIPTGSWIEAEMEGAPRRENFEFGMITGPSFEKGGKKFVYSNWGQLFIPEGAKNVEAAKEFMRFYYTKQSMISLAKYGNAVEPIKDGKEIVKEYITPIQYEMFDLFNECTAIMPDYEPLAVGSKIDVYDLIYGKSGTKVLSGQMTAAQWAEEVERGFAQIREEKEKTE